MVLMDAGEIGVRVLVAALGLFWLIMSLKSRNARPPQWVAAYTGTKSAANSLPWLGVALLGLSGGGLSIPGADWTIGIPGALLILGLVLWAVGSLVYCPRFMLPGWYRAAKGAGVNVQDPGAVQAFRDSRQGAA